MTLLSVTLVLSLSICWTNGQQLGYGGVVGSLTPRTGSRWPPYPGATRGYWAERAGFYNNQIIEPSSNLQPMKQFTTANSDLRNTKINFKQGRESATTPVYVTQSSPLKLRQTYNTNYNVISRISSHPAIRTTPSYYSGSSAAWPQFNEVTDHPPLVNKLWQTSSPTTTLYYVPSNELGGGGGGFGVGNRWSSSLI